MKLGLSPKEAGAFRVSKLLRSMAFPNNNEYRENARFEYDVTETARDESNKDTDGLVIPDEVLANNLSERALTAQGADSEGGYTVDDKLNPSIIEVFRENNWAMNNVQTLTGLQGNVTIPKHKTRSNAHWTGETVAPTVTEPSFEVINLSPNHVRTFVDVSRTLLFQNAVGLEQLIRTDIGYAISTAVDKMLLYGTGEDNEPTGIVNTEDIQNISWDGSTTSTLLDKILDGEEQLAGDNVPLSNTQWLSSVRLRRRLKRIQTLGSNTNKRLWDRDNVIIEYPAAYSTQVDTDEIFFGRWNWALLALWGGLEIMENPYTKSTQGIITFQAFQRADVAVMYPEAFAWMGITPSITTTTTAISWASSSAITAVTLEASGSGPFTWTVKSGSTLPAGISLSSGGVLSGTPTTAQAATATVFVVTTPAGSDEHSISITVT